MKEESFLKKCIITLIMILIIKLISNPRKNRQKQKDAEIRLLIITSQIFSDPTIYDVYIRCNHISSLWYLNNNGNMKITINLESIL